MSGALARGSSASSHLVAGNARQDRRYIVRYENLHPGYTPGDDFVMQAELIAGNYLVDLIILFR
jgi:hypothetical protein